MTTVTEFAADFDEDPGYLDFARVGPVGRAVIDEQRAMTEILAKARFGSHAVFAEQDARVRGAVAQLIGFRADQVVFQPNTSSGLMHAMFGITGDVLVAPSEFPSITFAATRAAQALHVLEPQWLETDYGRVTPASVREGLTDGCAAVAVSLVDFRTGYLADLEGIRQVIGDRLLIVDAIQGFGVVDAPWSVADVVVSGGQKWTRAGWGTGFLALSDRAVERLTPVVSGFTGTASSDFPMDEVLPPATGAAAFQVSYGNPIAQAGFATALEHIADVGVPAIHDRISQTVSEIIDLADEFAVPVASSRAAHERAGIVVLAPEPERLTHLTAALFNHGISATTRSGTVRLSAHVSTSAETLRMLADSFLSYATTVSR